MADSELKEKRELSKEIAKSVDTTNLAPDLHTGKASIESKIKAATAYILEGGNAKKAAKIANVHPNSLYAWKKEQWWGELVQYLKEDFQEDFKHRLTHVAGKALDVVEDRLENGDRVMNYKTGEMVEKPVQAKDASIILGVLSDKARVMEGLPTSISGSSSESERLNKLLGYFEQFARKQEEKIVGEQ